MMVAAQLPRGGVGIEKTQVSPCLQQSRAVGAGVFSLVLQMGKLRQRRLSNITQT